jgi:hypothetical protein
MIVVKSSNGAICAAYLGERWQSLYGGLELC